MQTPKVTPRSVWRAGRLALRSLPYTPVRYLLVDGAFFGIYGLLVAVPVGASLAGAVAIVVFFVVVVRSVVVAIFAVRHFPGSLAARKPITTERLILRPPEEGDAAGVAASIDDIVISESGWRAWVAPYYIDSLRTESRRHLLCEAGFLVACDCSGAVVGAVVAQPAFRGPAWVVGGWVAPAARHDGLAQEGLAAVVHKLHDGGIADVYLGAFELDDAAAEDAAAIGAHPVNKGPRVNGVGAKRPSHWFLHSAAAVEPSQP